MKSHLGAEGFTQTVSTEERLNEIKTQCVAKAKEAANTAAGHLHLKLLKGKGAHGKTMAPILVFHAYPDMVSEDRP